MHYVNTMDPKYSSIDLTEVELPETDNDHNANSEIERDDENTNTLHDVSIVALHCCCCFFFTFVGSCYIEHSHGIKVTFQDFCAEIKPNLLFSQMRHEMVLQKENEMELSVLTHSDDMRRVAMRTQRYVHFHSSALISHRPITYSYQ